MCLQHMKRNYLFTTGNLFEILRNNIRTILINIRNYQRIEVDTIEAYRTLARPI